MSASTIGIANEQERSHIANALRRGLALHYSNILGNRYLPFPVDDVLYLVHCGCVPFHCPFSRHSVGFPIFSRSARGTQLRHSPADLPPARGSSGGTQD